MRLKFSVCVSTLGLSVGKVLERSRLVSGSKLCLLSMIWDGLAGEGGSLCCDLWFDVAYVVSWVYGKKVEQIGVRFYLLQM